jgi:magnesium chelatase family protein
MLGSTAIVNDLDVYAAHNLKDVVQFFNQEGSLEKISINTREEFFNNHSDYMEDFADVKVKKTSSGHLK